MAIVYVSKDSRGDVEFWYRRPTKHRETLSWTHRADTRETRFEGDEWPYSGSADANGILAKLVKGLGLRKGQCRCVNLCEVEPDTV